MTISQAVAFLETAYEVLNKQYFDSALPKVIITIQSSPTAYGHCTYYDAWKDDKKGYREINIGAEKLDRPLSSTIATLVHEMVHVYCHENKIRDTSRKGRYHNKEFKVEAEKRGLIIEYDKTIGHSITSPSKELKSFIHAQHWSNKLRIHRVGEVGNDTEKKKKPTSTRKYVCSSCEVTVRATKDVYIICGDCGVPMDKV